jgi:hypothetical protein
MTGYYDIILGLIPLAMAGITGGLLLAGLELTTAIPLASVAAVALIGHAMFVRAPVDPTPAEPTPTESSTQSNPTQTAD